MARVYGSDNFDVEVWNENQAFLDESTYFNPVPDPGGKGSTTYTVLRATIHMLRNPANGLTAIRVGDGFSNQSPFTSGTTVPPGTAARRASGPSIPRASPHASLRASSPSSPSITCLGSRPRR